MKFIGPGATAALFLSTSMVHAIGLDRSNQDVTALFETGNVVELSFGMTQPSVSGTDIIGNGIDGVAQDFNQVSASVKMDINAQLSFALILDQPVGADIEYGGDPLTTVYGGTFAQLDSRAVTALARYKLTENFSVHGGLRYQTLSARIGLSGQGYRALSGYEVQLDDSSATGFVAGVAYERPDIALRVALTYNQGMTHEFDTVETVPAALQAGFGLPPLVPGTTEVDTPDAVNLDFQTGIAEDTLLFGSIRWADYDVTRLTPTIFGTASPGSSLTNIDTNFAYSVGVGRRFSDTLSGSVSVGWEPETDSLASPLDPTNGRTWVQVGGQYTMDAITVSAGVRYTMLGDAEPATGGVVGASFEDNDALSLGINIAYRF